MDKIVLFFSWVKENHVNVLISLAALVAFLEALVRLTPTKADDGAVSRIGKLIDFILDALKVPNVNKIQTFKVEDRENKNEEHH